MWVLEVCRSVLEWEGEGLNKTSAGCKSLLGDWRRAGRGAGRVRVLVGLRVVFVRLGVGTLAFCVGGEKLAFLTVMVFELVLRSVSWDIRV